MGNKVKKSKLIVPKIRISRPKKLAVERDQNQQDMVIGKRMDAV